MMQLSPLLKLISLDLSRELSLFVNKNPSENRSIALGTHLGTTNSQILQKAEGDLHKIPVV